MSLYDITECARLCGTCIRIILSALEDNWMFQRRSLLPAGLVRQWTSHYLLDLWVLLHTSLPHW